jgi:hypothetical protein
MALMTRANTAGFVFFDDAPSTETVDLDDQLRHQFGIGERVTSMPIFSTIVGEVALAVIRVTHKARTRYQLYAITHDTWTLTAVYGCYPDAMSELLRWRRCLSQGGTVAEWQLRHGDWVIPEKSGF